MNCFNLFYELIFIYLFVLIYLKGVKNGDIMFIILKGVINVRILEMGKLYNFLSKYNVKLIIKKELLNYW